MGKRAMIKKVLIANRGEIAVRIINACRDLGIPSVAVYSTVDRSSLHVQLADEAVCIGPAEPLKSYLNIDMLIDVAKRSQADAIHPGYGFLAESPQFVRRCEEEGLIFIGPSSRVMQLMGDKITARKSMQSKGIPIIPGMMRKSSDLDELERAAEEIGYPVLIKASGGGGGKGMRIVSSRDQLREALESSMREARSAFADPSLYLERYIQEPRHIEVQVAADSFGNVVHLFERECSIQRRYQKLVEETPSTALTPELRARMGEAAIQVARASGYNNMGTVEFIMDKDKKFYFLEMNTRIQVEHPVTELTTGVDLVKEQIKVAGGQRLSFKQQDIKPRGHAIECRIYAEDPANNFLPSPGKIWLVSEPSGPGIRVDSGIYSGCEVSPYYDPILAKLIVWGEDRESAIKRAISALRRYVIMGITTTIQFLIDLLEHPEFIAGNTSTAFIPRYMGNWGKRGDRYITEAMVLGAIYVHNTKAKQRETIKVGIPSPWETLGDWSIG
jgi:acetyl-CoA carboxylase biotin carboxylase subunit